MVFSIQAKHEVLAALMDMVIQHCTCDHTANLDSMASSANADAMRLLARHGKIEIVSDKGRRVIAIRKF